MVAETSVNSEVAISQSHILTMKSMVVMTPPGVFGKPDLYEIIKISDDLNNGWCPVGLVST